MSNKKTQLKNQVQLISYADSVGSGLRDLNQFLDKYIGDAIGGIHMLPFYPSSGDRGFAPLTHLEVEPSFGDWSDIRTLSDKYDLVADLVANHMSADSPMFKDFIKHGKKSKYADLFLTVEKLFPNGLDHSTLKTIYRPRPGDPFTKFTTETGEELDVWISFSKDQIDLDWSSDQTRELNKEFVKNLVKNGAKLIRLDAIGYICKKPGTSSFLILESYEIIDWFLELAEEIGVEYLAEVHYHYSKQLELANSCHWIYDFVMPVQLIHAMEYGTSRYIKHWMHVRPHNQITTLDTHDGIGITDVQDLIPDNQVYEVVETLLERGGNKLMRKLPSGGEGLYQVNMTYYSAVGSDDQAYLLARAVQFFAPGIPQVYFVGLLAGENDQEKYQKTGVGRDTNRHDYSIEEAASEVQKPVVQRLLKLMRFRNTHPAFNGHFKINPSDGESLSLSWWHDGKELNLYVNFKDKVFQITDDGQKVEI